MKRRKEEFPPRPPREILSEDQLWHGVMEDIPDSDRHEPWAEASSECEKTLLFFSRELDGEAQERDRASAEAHGVSCSSCRRQVEALRSLERLQEDDRRRCRMVAERSTPEAPSIVGVKPLCGAATRSEPASSDAGKPPQFPFRKPCFPGVGSSFPQWLRWGWRGAAAAALLLLGRFWGESTRPLFPEVLSSDGALPALVTPARWGMGGARGTPGSFHPLSEAPFAERLRVAQEDIAEELRKTPPDWSRIRRLAELVGELRTDLELLALHMAYLDIVAGTSPDAVAERWHTLSGSSGSERHESL